MTKVPAIKQIGQSVKKLEPNLRQSLPAGMDAERFIQKAMNAITMHPQRDKLEQADRQSLLMSIQKSAADGLNLDGREATLVCFYDKNKGSQVAQYIPMTQGLVKLARNSGEIANISSEVVYKNDKFELYHDLEGTYFKHEPSWEEERIDPILVWASVKTKDGEVIARALTKQRIMAIASKSNNSFQYDPQKGPHFEEWWRKTAIKNVLKYAPKSTELERTLERENQTFEIKETTEEKPEKKPKKTKAAQVIEESAEEDIIDAVVVNDEPQEDQPQFNSEEIPI